MKTISAPAGLTGAPLAELKQWLAITTDAEDELLVDLLAVAHAMCERFTGLVPYNCEVRETFAATGIAFVFATRPVIGLIDATAIDHGLNRRLLDASEATFERVDADGGRLTLTSAIDEPQVEVRFYAGLTDDWSRIDDGLRQGIIRYAAHQYRERDGSAADSPPAAIAALWRPYRRMRL